MNTNFVQHFFPYHNFGSDIITELVTPWAVLVIFLFTFLSAIYLYYNIRSLGSSLVQLEKGFDKNLEETIKELRSHSRLSHLWAEYERSFINNRNNLLSTCDATEIFDEQSVISVKVNLRYWTAVPGIILAVGIFGTFLGLTLGIQGFDTSSAEGIQDSIQTLLNGMGTAFLTSLWGMALSILFNVHEKWQFHELRKKLDRFNSVLNNKFQLTTEETRKLEKDERSRLASKLFVFEIDGKKILPSHALRDLVTNSQQQTAALKAFSTDLSEGILLSTETINALGDRILDSIKPTSDKLTEAVEQLIAQKSESSAGFLEKIAQNLNESTEGILNQFQDTVSESTVKQLENLSLILSDAGDTIAEFPERFEQIFRQISTMMDRQEELSEKSIGLLKGFQESINDISALSENLEKTSGLLAGTSATLNTTAESTSAVAGTLDSSMEVFQHQTEKILGSQNDTMNQFGDSMNILSSLPGQLENVKGQFGLIFEEMENGLEDYQRVTKDSINQYLGQFSEQVASAVSHLAGGIEELDEVVSSIASLNEKADHS